MRHAKNFHPEWGFLAPAPSFMRTLRTVFVATAVGATAGGGLVLSLIDHSAGQTSVAERTLVRPIPTASTSVGAPQIARLNPRRSIRVTPRRFRGLTATQAALRRAKRTPAPHCGRQLLLPRSARLPITRLQKPRLRRRLPSKRA